MVNLEWHQERLDRSRKQLFKTSAELNLATSLKVPEQHAKGVVKCRVSYGMEIGQVEYSEYTKKPVKSLQQVDCAPFDYGVKYQDRTRLEALYQLRGPSDEILITHRGLLTDTSYSNVTLYDGAHWYTPEKPLLEGTQRAKLLASGLLKPVKIHISNIGDFQKLVLINAMLEFDPESYIEIGNIKLWK